MQGDPIHFEVDSDSWGLNFSFSSCQLDGMFGLPPNPSVADVVIRLARPEERVPWDSLMAEHHELGFVRFVGRGLRYVAVLGTLRIGLAGWQAGALKRRPRDRFIGWRAPQQY